MTLFYDCQSLTKRSFRNLSFKAHSQFESSLSRSFIALKKFLTLSIEKYLNSS